MAKNLNTVFPFYDAKAEQYRYRDDVDLSPCLITADTTLVPFVIRRTHTAGAVTDITLQFFDLNDNLIQTFTGTASSTPTANKIYLTITQVDTVDFIIYDGTALGSALLNGARYIVLTDAYPSPNKKYYSETFIVQNNLSEYLKLEFKNWTQVSYIPANMTQVIYLNTSLKTPEYLREDTGDKRDGVIVREKQVVMKSYNLRSLIAPEYVVDALMLVPMMDQVWVTTQTGVVYTDFNEIRIKDPEWQAEALGSRAKIEIQLITDVIVKKLNYKELNHYSTITTVGAEVKSGSAVTTTAGGGLFGATILFAEAFVDANYTPAVYASSVAEPHNVEIAEIRSLYATGFTVYTTVACNIYWSAIHN